MSTLTPKNLEDIMGELSQRTGSAENHIMSPSSYINWMDHHRKVALKLFIKKLIGTYDEDDELYNLLKNISYDALAMAKWVEESGSDK